MAIFHSFDSLREGIIFLFLTVFNMFDFPTCLASFNFRSNVDPRSMDFPGLFLFKAKEASKGPGFVELVIFYRVPDFDSAGFMFRSCWETFHYADLVVSLRFNGLVEGKMYRKMHIDYSS